MVKSGEFGSQGTDTGWFRDDQKLVADILQSKYELNLCIELDTVLLIAYN